MLKVNNKNIRTASMNRVYFTPFSSFSVVKL